MLNEHTVLDASLQGYLGANTLWEDIHRVRPRPLLTCRGCKGALHAKQSGAGMRFFAHDSRDTTCPLGEETLAHRLLKTVLASTGRDAGWTAELEAAGEGWRADVLLTSPDGTRRFAWEAQLASISVGAIKARNQTMEASGMRVCWVTDKQTAWLGDVPSLQVAIGGNDLTVVDGIQRFQPAWCEDNNYCEEYPYYAETCPGHGYWQKPAGTLTLPQIVQQALRGQLQPAYLEHADIGKESYQCRREGPPIGWTHPSYLKNAQDQLDAEEASEAALEEEQERGETYQQRLDALMERQDLLTPYAVGILRAQHGPQAKRCTLRWEASAMWAMGVPVGLSDTDIRMVVCPVASRIDTETALRLGSVEIVVADMLERDRILAKCRKGQSVRVVDLRRMRT